MKWSAVKDLNKVGNISASELIQRDTKREESEVKSPQPAEGRAINYGYRELWSDCCLGPQMGGLKKPNFNVNAKHGLIQARGTKPTLDLNPKTDSGK